MKKLLALFALLLMFGFSNAYSNVGITAGAGLGKIFDDEANIEDKMFWQAAVGYFPDSKEYYATIGVKQHVGTITVYVEDPLIINKTVNVDAITSYYNVSGYYQFAKPSKNVGLYVFGGVGLADLTVKYKDEKATSDSRFAFNLGVNAKYMFNRQFALSFDVDYMKITQEFSVFSGTLNLQLNL